MASSNNLRVLTPGFLCSGTDCVTVRETDDVIDCIIEPEKDSMTTLHFNFPENVSKKKYTIEVNFSAINAVLHIYGLYQLRDNQFADIKTTINHLVPQCESKQIWRGVLEDASKAIFEGKIIVHPNAQKTNAQLSNKNLLLSDNADINTKPTLEIYADDVKCSHGATVGFLDQDALFYLRSRGIDENRAREILVQAFIDEIRFPPL